MSYGVVPRSRAYVECTFYQPIKQGLKPLPTKSVVATRLDDLFVLPTFVQFNRVAMTDFVAREFIHGTVCM